MIPPSEEQRAPSIDATTTSPVDQQASNLPFRIRNKVADSRQPAAFGNTGAQYNPRQLHAMLRDPSASQSEGAIIQHPSSVPVEPTKPLPFKLRHVVYDRNTLAKPTQEPGQAVPVQNGTLESAYAAEDKPPPPPPKDEKHLKKASSRNRLGMRKASSELPETNGVSQDGSAASVTRYATPPTIGEFSFESGDVPERNAQPDTFSSATTQ